jgi:hypothetical protein
MRAQTRLEAVSGIRRNILEEAAPSLFGCRVASRQFGTGSAERGVSERRRTEERIRMLELSDQFQLG